MLDTDHFADHRVSEQHSPGCEPRYLYCHYHSHRHVSERHSPGCNVNLLSFRSVRYVLQRQTRQDVNRPPDEFRGSI